ncbi:hypothetical protein Tco_1159695 [Tanacetum coccineum]
MRPKAVSHPTERTLCGGNGYGGVVFGGGGCGVKVVEMRRCGGLVVVGDAQRGCEVVGGVMMVAIAVVGGRNPVTAPESGGGRQKKRGSEEDDIFGNGRGDAEDFGYFRDVGFSAGYIGGSGSWHFVT